jgi:hypothetical protein
VTADAISLLTAFIDERWAVAQPRIVPEASQRPYLSPSVTAREAHDFLACVTSHGAEPPLLVVDDQGKERSDRYPRLSNGNPRGYNFFEAPGRVRHETIVGWAALARLRYEFGWPRARCSNNRPARRGPIAIVLRPASDLGVSTPERAHVS